MSRPNFTASQIPVFVKPHRDSSKHIRFIHVRNVSFFCEVIKTNLREKQFCECLTKLSELLYADEDADEYAV